MNTVAELPFALASEERLHRLDQRFAVAISGLHTRLEQLLQSRSFTYLEKPVRLPTSVVYLFSENGTPLYVGRTNNFSQRLGNHCRAGSKANQSSFAFKLAREAAGITEAAYTGDATRDALMMRPEFLAGFTAAKKRLNVMQIRFVEECDQVQQALLEIYCAVALKTSFNQFGTH
ncbi:MAG TPA: GIY-YIG nuclease family protein [Rhizomicrobium sp.]|jgi:predicted GIY-YIG superfamily endonuclease|nr:GIY-YIG nuclease family protein [Rhizomicrobium sp.]